MSGVVNMSGVDADNPCSQQNDISLEINDTFCVLQLDMKNIENDISYDHLVDITSEVNCDNVQKKTHEMNVVKLTMCHEQNTLLEAECEKRDDFIQFIIGKGQECVTVRKSKLTASSEVFAAMLDGPWKEHSEERVKIMDTDPHTFITFLSWINDGDKSILNANNIWNVLKLADKYAVISLIDVCFHYLIHVHKSRRKKEHICSVLEFSHSFNHQASMAECFLIVRRKANEILKSEACLKLLCYDCMLRLVKDGELNVDEEKTVHDAVLAWTRFACEKNGFQINDFVNMRETAKDLVFYVRYLLMPLDILRHFTPGDPKSCLLHNEEKDNLLHDCGSLFPLEVKCPRLDRKIKTNRSKHHICANKRLRTGFMTAGFIINIVLLIAIGLQGSIVVTYLGFVCLSIFWFIELFVVTRYQREFWEGPIVIIQM